MKVTNWEMISDEINISVSLTDCDMLHPTIWFYLDMPHRFFIIMMIYISTENLSVDGIESTRVAVQSRCQRILQTESGREYGGWFFTDVHDRRWHDQLPGWAIWQHQFLTCISLSITMSMVCTIRFCPANLTSMRNIFTLFLHVNPYSISPIQICSALVILCLKFVLFVS